MTTQELNADRVEAAARALLDDKVTAVRDLVTARQDRDVKRAELVEAERADAARYAPAGPLRT